MPAVLVAAGADDGDNSSNATDSVIAALFLEAMLKQRRQDEGTVD